MSVVFGTVQPEPDVVEAEAEAFAEPVQLWRRAELCRLGFNRRQRLALCGQADVAHAAEALLAAGCPVAVAFDILS